VSSIFRILITYSLFPRVKAGIRNRSEGFVVTDLSFPAFLYEGYTANPDDLEEGLFKGKILVQVCCARACGLNSVHEPKQILVISDLFVMDFAN
jgi:hypothetical protein